MIFENLFKIFNDPRTACLLGLGIYAALIGFLLFLDRRSAVQLAITVLRPTPQKLALCRRYYGKQRTSVEYETNSGLSLFSLLPQTATARPDLGTTTRLRVTTSRPHHQRLSFVCPLTRGYARAPPSVVRFFLILIFLSKSFSSSFVSSTPASLVGQANNNGSPTKGIAIKAVSKSFFANP